MLSCVIILPTPQIPQNSSLWTIIFTNSNLTIPISNNHKNTNTNTSPPILQRPTTDTLPAIYSLNHAKNLVPDPLKTSTHTKTRYVNYTSTYSNVPPIPIIPPTSSSQYRPQFFPNSFLTFPFPSPHFGFNNITYDNYKSNRFTSTRSNPLLFNIGCYH